MKKDNKGFSLVELIVTFAIISIIGLAVYGFMSVSNRQFVATSNDVGLQYDQQIVVNQIRDYILESSNAIYYDDTDQSLYVFKQTNEKIDAVEADPMAGTPETPGVQYAYRVSKLRFDNPNGDKAPGDEGYDDTLTGNITVKTLLMDVIDNSYKDSMNSLTEKVMGANVKSISYDLSDVAEHNKVEFDITFLKDGKEFSSHQIVSLRNTIIDSDELGKIYVAKSSEVISSIQSVSILRNGIVISTGEADDLTHIGKYGVSDVNVQLTASVEALAASKVSYDKGVTWSAVDPTTGNAVENFIDQTGLVTVKGTMDAGTVVRVIATSKDDVNKSGSVDLTIDENGIYPVSANLDLSNVQNFPGYNLYTFLPEVTYTNALGGSSNKLRGEELLTGNMKIEWHISGDELPETIHGIKSELDDRTGKMSLTDAAEGKEYDIWFTVKERMVDGSELKSNVIHLTPSDIHEYVAPESIKLTMDGESNRGDTTVATVSWLKTPTGKVRYFWKIEADADNSTGRWNDASVAAIATNFDKTVSVIGDDSTDDNYFKYVGSLGDTYGSFDGTDSYGWYESTDSQRFANIYIESYLYWMSSFKIRVSCFAVGLDSNDKPVTIYDATGTHDISENKPIVPVLASTVIPKVQLILEESTNFKGTDGYKTGKNIQQNVKLPGEQRAFVYKVLGLSLFAEGGGISSLVSDNKTINTHYIFYNSAGKKVNINRYTGNAGYVLAGESRVDKEELNDAYNQFMFELDISKINRKDPNKKTEFYTYNPQKMNFNMTLTQEVEIDGVKVKNKADSNVFNYNLKYKNN